MLNLQSKGGSEESKDGDTANEGRGAAVGLSGLSSSTGSSARGLRVIGRVSGVGLIGGARLGSSVGDGGIGDGGGDRAGSAGESGLNSGLGGRLLAGAGARAGTGTGLTGSTVLGVPVVVLDTLLLAGSVLLSVGGRAATLVTLGSTLGGLLDLLLVGRGDADAVRLALGVTKRAVLDTGGLRSLDGVQGNGSTLGRGKGGESAGNEGSGETHVESLWVVEGVNLVKN